MMVPRGINLSGVLNWVITLVLMVFVFPEQDWSPGGAGGGRLC